MPKSNKIKNKSNNKTKKLNKICPISLKPFEEKFSKELSVKETKKLKSIETIKKKHFAKELLARFAPSSIKPNNNFYDYINYLWIKNVTLKE